MFVGCIHSTTALAFTAVTSCKHRIHQWRSLVDGLPLRSLLSPHPNVIVCWSPEQWHLSTAVGKPGNPFLAHNAGKYLSMLRNALLSFFFAFVHVDDYCHVFFPFIMGRLYLSAFWGWMERIHHAFFFELFLSRAAI